MSQRSERIGQTHSYASVRGLLEQCVPAWFAKQRLVGGGGSLIVHIASRGLPKSRHYDTEAARLQTLAAPDRLKYFEELLEVVCGELRIPIYLFELSVREVEMFRTNARLLKEGERLGPQLQFCVLPQKRLESIHRQMKWNPAMRLHLEGGPNIESLWKGPLAAPTEQRISTRLQPIMQDLQSERCRRLFPIRLLYTEAEIDCSGAILEWNSPYFTARQTERVIEYFKITEPW